MNLSFDQEITEITNVSGAFGSDVRFVSFVLNSRHTKQVQIASTVVFGTVTVTDNADKLRRCQLVIKFKHRKSELRVLLKTDLHFYNEIMFYEQIVPFLSELIPVGDDRVPPLARYIYGRNDCGELSLRDMIIFENASSHGYRSAQCAHRLNLDHDHVIVALKTLAKFHGLSYRAKHADPTKFARMVDQIMETQWDANNEWYISENGIHEILKPIIEKLEERYGNKSNDRLNRFRTELLREAKQTLWRTIQPTEPLAVLCHGDFNRNNMMFRYDDDGVRPVDAMAFDMATIRYGSPAIDLSFFLYMNTDRQLREAHWDELLNAYCAALSLCVADMADCVLIPDRAQIDAEIRQHAFYGLMHASFFVRMMLEDSLNPLQWTNHKPEEVINLVLMYGGNRATETIADILQHFIDIKYNNLPLSS